MCSWEKWFQGVQDYLIWSPEKVNVDQTAVKIGQSWLNMQAVPLACSLF